MSSKSFTTGLSTGIPSLLRIASASRSGVAGDERAVGSGGAFGIAENSDPLVDLLFELDFVDETSISMAPKKWPMPFDLLGLRYACSRFQSDNFCRQCVTPRMV
jgi:hypothetical protein